MWSELSGPSPFITRSMRALSRSTRPVIERRTSSSAMPPISSRRALHCSSSSRKCGTTRSPVSAIVFLVFPVIPSPRSHGRGSSFGAAQDDPELVEGSALPQALAEPARDVVLGQLLGRRREYLVRAIVLNQAPQPE